MTESQAVHHAEQMEAARKEFAEWWPSEVAFRQHLQMVGLPARAEHEKTAWDAFIYAKGLKNNFQQ